MTTADGAVTASNAYTYRESATYSYASQKATAVNCDILGGADIPFSNNGSITGVTHNPGYAVFTVHEAGDYLINYGVNITAGIGSALAITVNGTVDPSTVIPSQIATGLVTGCAVVRLPAEAEVTLRNNSGVPLTMTLDPSVGAQLSMVKLHASYAYELATTIADSTVTGTDDVRFSNNGSLNGVTHAPGDAAFTVMEDGDYLINYGANITAGVGSALGIAVKTHEVDPMEGDPFTVDPSTVISSLNATGLVRGCAVLSLTHGNVIKLRNHSATPLVMSLEPSVGAQMSIVKLLNASYAYEQATIADSTVMGNKDVPFSNNGSLNGVAHTPGDTAFMVSETGDYLINYQINITAGVGSALAIAVNGAVDPSTVIPSLNATGLVTGCAVVRLTAGQSISLRNNSGTPLVINETLSAGAQLSICKIQ